MSYSQQLAQFDAPHIIHTHGWPCDTAAAVRTSVLSGNWSTNAAYLFAFQITKRRTYLTCIWATGTVSGGQSDIDIGVYDMAGNRQGSLGSTAQGASNTITVATFGSAITLNPGRWLLAMACNGADGTMRTGMAATSTLRASFGCFRAASAFPLPSSLTLLEHSHNYVPVFGISELSTL